MRAYEQILEESKAVDALFAAVTDLDTVQIHFTVPHAHPRASSISEYTYIQRELAYICTLPLYKNRKRYIFVTDSVNDFPFVKQFTRNEHTTVLPATEGAVKTVAYMNALLAQLQIPAHSLIIAIGGGLLLNVAAYTAEQTKSDLIQVPTTVLSMADGSGGKVRLNMRTPERGYKHFYKSFYEPNLIVLDQRFLAALPLEQKKIGLVEIIKHGLFQSPALYDHLLHNCQFILEDTRALKKAVLWSAYLKQVCLRVDVEELDTGSKKILRGGHAISDRIEENSGFSIPHGYAVAAGIVQELKFEGNEELLKKAIAIFDAYGIPY